MSGCREQGGGITMRRLRALSDAQTGDQCLVKILGLGFRD
jgi:hypothetical protein